MNEVNKIFEEVYAEIVRQSDDGRSFDHPPLVWLAIVNQYIGRAARELFEGANPLRETLIKIAALVVVWILSIKSLSPGTKENPLNRIKPSDEGTPMTLR